MQKKSLIYLPILSTLMALLAMFILLSYPIAHSKPALSSPTPSNVAVGTGPQTLLTISDLKTVVHAPETTIDSPGTQKLVNSGEINADDTNRPINIGKKVDKVATLLPFETYSETAKHIDTLQSGEEKTIEIQTDSLGQTSFFLSWVGDSTPTFSLITPDQTEITPSYAAANPDKVEYGDGTENLATFPFLTYTFPTGQPGTWQVKLVGGTSKITFMVFAAQRTFRALEIQLDKWEHKVGENVVITAKLTNHGVDIPGANVTAQIMAPDDTQTQIALQEQPNRTYQGTYTAPNASGFLLIQIQAKGQDQGVKYNLGASTTSMVILEGDSQGKIKLIEHMKTFNGLFTTNAQTGMLEAGETKNIKIQLSGKRPTQFVVSWRGKSQPGFSLVSPSGLEITPSYADANDNIGFSIDDTQMATMPFQRYSLTGEPGTWQVKLVGGSDPIDYEVFAAQQINYTINISVNQSLYQVGDNAVITVNLTDGGIKIMNPTAIAKVTSPDGEPTQITLSEQSNGIYTGNFIPNKPGVFHIKIQATEKNQDIIYDASKSIELRVLEGGPTLTGMYKEIAINEDADPQFDKLAIDVELDVPQGDELIISAGLYAGEKLVSTSNLDIVNVTQGKQMVRLLFDGQKIRRMGLDGPYTLTIQEIISMKQGLMMGEKSNLFQTAPYQYNQFGKPLKTGPFMKISPEYEAKNTETNPTLRWHASQNAISYQYCYDTIDNNICDTGWISNDDYIVTQLNNLEPNTTYYWQVQAIGPDDTREADNNRWGSFTTE